MSKLIVLLNRCITLVLLSVLLLPASSRADKLSLLADFEYIISENKLFYKTDGRSEKTKSDRFSQLYTLDLDKSLSPYLTFNAGGSFDLNETDTDTDGVKRTNKDQQIRPHVGLELNNPFYRSSIDYRKSELKNSGTNQPTTRTFSEEYTANFSWRPSDLPSLNMEYVRIYSYDEPKTRDSVNDGLSLASRYDYKQYNFDLSHTRNQTREKLVDFKTRTVNTSGGARYSDNYLNGDLDVNAGVKLSQSTIEFEGEGERLLRTFPIGDGFYLLNDPFPGDNISGEFTGVTTSTPFSTVNIGNGGGTNQVSFGLFFNGSVAVDVIWVSLSTFRLSDNLANQFEWFLYVSDDQLTWTQVPVTVEYLNLENRFEFRPIRTLTEEYFKIVTTPLDLAATGEIRIRDVQSWSIETAPKVESTNQYYNAGFDYRFSTRTSLGYDTYYQHQTANPGGSRSRLSNGVGLNHRFNQTFIGTTRLLRSDTWLDGVRDLTSHNFSASLKALYLRTFNQTLTYNFNHIDEQVATSHSNAIILRSNLDLYKGFSLSADQGYSWQKTLVGGDTTSVFVRGRTHIVPHRRIDLNLDYGVTWGTSSEQPDIRTDTGRFNGFWLVMDTVSLSTNINYRKTDSAGEKQTRVLRDYTVAWSPLLQGDIQFSVVYTESGTTDDEDSKTLSENIRWRMTSYSLLTLSHSKGTFETRQQRNENESIFMNLRIYY